MKILSIIILSLLVTTSCFATDVYLRDGRDSSLMTPLVLGALDSSSNPVITTAYGALPMGASSGITKVVISVPSGTAYFGDSTIAQNKGLAWAATQGALILDVKTTSGLYWTGVTDQKMNFIILK